MFTQVHRERGFPHGRTRSNNDQIGRLKTGSHFIQVSITTGNPGHTVVWFMKQLFDFINGLFQQDFQWLRPFSTTGTLFRNLEYFGFSQI